MSEPNGPEAKNGQEAKDEKSFSADYVKELREEAKQNRIAKQQLEDRLKEFETKQQQAERERAEKQGEFEALYKTEAQKAEDLAKKVAAYESRLAAFEEREKAELEKIIGKLPDELKEELDESIPLSKQLSLAKKLAAVADKYKGNPEARLPGTPSGMPDNLSAKEKLNWMRENGKM